MSGIASCSGLASTLCERDPPRTGDNHDMLVRAEEIAAIRRASRDRRRGASTCRGCGTAESAEKQSCCRLLLFQRGNTGLICSLTRLA